MIQELPFWLNALFLLTVGATILLFFYANGRKRWLLLVLLGWSILQSVLAYSGFYLTTNTFPPRFILVLLPTTLLIMAGLLPKYRDEFLKGRNQALSTFLHAVRVPVEIVLLFLFLNKMIPELMTFEGRNFDIVAGLTAPVMGILILTKRASRSMLIGWNILSLILVSLILFHGILSAELPFQQFAFEQPNRAVNYFPFVLLPAVIVPIVIYTHLSDLIILLKEKKSLNTGLKSAGREMAVFNKNGRTKW